ncbi:MAG: hypothetical protein WC360_01025 [Opitutales bacterium]|jgi:hypothetical protein
MAKEVTGTGANLRGNAFIYGPDHMRVMNLEFDSMTKTVPNNPQSWTPLHYTDTKVCVGGGTAELVPDATSAAAHFTPSLLHYVRCFSYPHSI